MTPRIRTDCVIVAVLSSASVVLLSLLSPAFAAVPPAGDLKDIKAVACDDGTTQYGKYYLTDGIVCLGHGGAKGAEAPAARPARASR